MIRVNATATTRWVEVLLRTPGIDFSLRGASVQMFDRKPMAQTPQMMAAARAPITPKVRASPAWATLGR